MKSYCLRFLGFILCSMLFFPSAFAQPQQTTVLVRGGETGGGDASNPFISNCGGPMEFDTYVANLDLFLPEGDEHFSDGFFHLPEHVPAMYLELSVEGSANNHYSITELTSFEFSHIVNGINIYKSTLVIDLPAPTGKHTIRWESKLLMVNDGSTSENGGASGDDTNLMGPNGETYEDEPVPGYLYYPIWNYREYNNLFPCAINNYETNVFYWTDCYNDACPQFDEYALHCTLIFPYYNGSIYCEGYTPPCNGCDQHFGLSESTDIYNLQADQTEMNNVDDVKVSPNPFQSEINIRFAAKDISNLNVEIININGQVVQSFEKPLWKGINEINLVVEDIPVGIYFVKMSDGIQSFTRKLIKN